jgi:hypothetical protein
MSKEASTSFCEQKEAKKLHPSPTATPRQVCIITAARTVIVSIEAPTPASGKSLFASFSSEKEGLPSFGAPA